MERIKEWDIQMESDGLFPTPDPPAYQRYMPRLLSGPTGSAPTSYYYDRQTAHHPSAAEEEWSTTVPPPTGDMCDEDPDAPAAQLSDSATERTKAYSLARQLVATLRPMPAIPLRAALRQINSNWNWSRDPPSGSNWQLNPRPKTAHIWILIRHYHRPRGRPPMAAAAESTRWGPWTLPSHPARRVLTKWSEK